MLRLSPSLQVRGGVKAGGVSARALTWSSRDAVPSGSICSPHPKLSVEQRCDSVSGVRAAQGSLQSGVRDFPVRLSYALAGCLDLLFKVSFSGSPHLPKIFLPVTTEQLHVLSIALWRWLMAGIFGKILLYYFLMFPLVRSSFHRRGRSAVAVPQFWCILIFQTCTKMPAAQGRHALKCVFMNLKLQTLSFFFFGFVFQISPVTS